MIYVLVYVIPTIVLKVGYALSLPLYAVQQRNHYFSPPFLDRTNNVTIFPTCSQTHSPLEVQAEVMWQSLRHAPLCLAHWPAIPPESCPFRGSCRAAKQLYTSCNPPAQAGSTELQHLPPSQHLGLLCRRGRDQTAKPLHLPAGPHSENDHARFTHFLSSYLILSPDLTHTHWCHYTKYISLQFKSSQGNHKWTRKLVGSFQSFRFRKLKLESILLQLDNTNASGFFTHFFMEVVVILTPNFRKH